MGKKYYWKAVALAKLSLLFFMILPVSAEPVIDRILSGVRVSERNGCAVATIDFNIRVRYISHFPFSNGREVRIKIQALDPDQLAREIEVKTEALRAPSNRRAAIRAIEFEINGSGPVLNVYFREPVAFQVEQGSDFQSMVVFIASSAASPDCQSSIAAGTAGRDNRRQIVTKGKKGDALPSKSRQKKGDASPSKPRRIKADKPRLTSNSSQPPAKRSGRGRGRGDTASLMKQARTALKKKQVDQAIRILTKVLSLPENKYTPEALELLGLARERNGQKAHAKAEFKEYLRRYPKGAGANRVKQRLAGILAAKEEPKGKLRKVKGEPGTARRKQDRLTSSERAAAEEKASWEVVGSLSQFYFRNQGFRRFVELESRRETEEEDVFQNALLTSADLTGRYETGSQSWKARFSASFDKDFESGGVEEVSVSSLFVDGKLKRSGVGLRVGRQRRNSGGILSRFDGAYVYWQANDWLKVNSVVGSPVDRSRDRPFDEDRYLYGVSIDLGTFYDRWDTSFFVVEQTSGSFVDRRAVGTELRYFDSNKSFFATADYDIHFNALNLATVSGSWSFPDQSTFSFAADYVNSPSLTTSNALQGQTVNSLDELNEIFSKSAIKELARDRTTQSRSATIGFSRPLGKRFQINADVTVIDTFGTDASGGVEATEAPGTEYFASTQLIGTGLLAESDVFLVGLRYANTFSTDLYLFDTYSRYPINGAWRVRPRLKLAYRDGKQRDFDEYQVLPSLTTNYKWTRDWSFELDVGGTWSKRFEPDSTEENIDIFFTFGYRYDFQFGNRR